MDNKLDKSDKHSQEVENPGRRQLLKLLAAGGVVTAASLLPSRWSSPVVKSGVLPAHAQVTPGQFDVVCNPEWDTANDEVFTTFFFSAAATSNGSPLANVDLRATVEAGQASPSSVETTDAQGVANFQIPVSNNSITQTPVATVTFNEPQIYGNASCMIVLGFPQ